MTLPRVCVCVLEHRCVWLVVGRLTWTSWCRNIWRRYFLCHTNNHILSPMEIKVTSKFNMFGYIQNTWLIHHNKDNFNHLTFLAIQAAAKKVWFWSCQVLWLFPCTIVIDEIDIIICWKTFIFLVDWSSEVPVWRLYVFSVNDETGLQDYQSEDQHV